MTNEVDGRVREFVDKNILPMLRADGGSLEVVEVTSDNVVRVRLTGACSGCPFSAMTLAVGVERALKDAVPEVVRVEPVP